VETTLIARTETHGFLTMETSDYIASALADGTQKLYAARWKLFVAWCEEQNHIPLPADPAVVANYLAELAHQKMTVSTIAGHRLAIATAHQVAGVTPPPTQAEVVRLTMKGIRRKLGVRPQPKTALLTQNVREMIRALPPTLIGTRDRALLLLGFAGAMRRSEIVALNVDDVGFHPEGLRVLIRRSKEDQEGEGQTIGIPYGSHPETCPVRALQEWLNAAHIIEGSLFRPVAKGGRLQPTRLSDRAVAEVVKRSAKRVGIDPETVSGHSLRSGFATTAAKCRVPERDIMRQTRHKSLEMVRRYNQEGELFVDNPAASIGL
jgi:integrase